MSNELSVDVMLVKCVHGVCKVVSCVAYLDDRVCQLSAGHAARKAGGCVSVCNICNEL